MRNSSYIHSLTGLRAIAAYMVFFYHVPVTWLAYDGVDFQKGFEIGVSIFFVLSGFVITHTYQAQYRLNLSWYLNYLKNRMGRIFPVYLLVAIPVLYFSKADIADWFLHLSLLNGLFQSEYYSQLTHAWSLTTEMWFYTLAPLLFLLLDRFKNFLFLFVIYLVFLVLFLILLAEFQPHVMQPEYALIKTFAGRFLEFYLGVWLAYKMKQKSFALKGPSTLIGVTGVLIAIIILTLRAAFLEEGDRWRFIVYVFTENVFLPVFTVFLIYGLIKERTFLSSLFSSKVFQILGHSSYSFYIIHVGILHTFLLKYIYSPLVFFVLIGFSVIIYYFFERPVTGFFKGINFLGNNVPKAQKISP